MNKNKADYIFFDFDNVLFNTTFLLSKIKNFTDEDKIFTLKTVKKVDWDAIKPENLVYSEIPKVLTSLQKKGYQLFLFSEGNIAGQLFKLKFSKLDKFFPKTKRFIYPERKEAEFPKLLKHVAKNIKKIWYFDDKPSKLKTVEDMDSRIQTVLVCRGPWWQTEIIGFKPDFKINNLTELEKIL